MSFPLWDMAYIIVSTTVPAMWFYAMVSRLASVAMSTDIVTRTTLGRLVIIAIRGIPVLVAQTGMQKMSCARMAFPARVQMTLSVIRARAQTVIVLVKLANV